MSTKPKRGKLSRAELERRRRLVDLAARYDALEAELERKAKAEGVPGALAEIASWGETLQPEEGGTFEGNEFYATLTARGNQRKVNGPLAAKYLGARFAVLASITIKACEEGLTPEQADEVISQPEATGPRKLSFSRRIQPAVKER